MNINLKVELIAYNKLAPSMLKDYVKDVQNPEKGVKYVRQLNDDSSDMEWISLGE